MTSLGIAILVVFTFILLLGLPLIQAHHLAKFKKDLKVLVRCDQDPLRNIQLEFSRNNIPGSLMTRSRSKQRFDQPGSAQQTPKEIWMPKAHYEAAMKIVEIRFRYHMPEFSVVIDGLRNPI